MTSRVNNRREKAAEEDHVRRVGHKFKNTREQFPPLPKTKSNSAKQASHPSRQPEPTTASNSAGQPTTPPSVLRQQMKRLREQLEEAQNTINKLTKELEGREEMRSVEGEGESFNLQQNDLPTTVMTPERNPEASSLPAVLPIMLEPQDDGHQEPPTKKPCLLMKEAKVLGVSHFTEKLGRRKRQRSIPYQH